MKIAKARSHVRAALATGGVPRDKAAALADLLRPCVRPQVEPEATTLNGRSKLGGHPDLPPDFVWPTLGGVPLGYVAQIALDETAGLEGAAELPDRGMLTFFFGTGPAAHGSYEAEPGRWAVVLSPAAASCVPRVPPVPSLFPEHRFSFSEGVSLPDAESFDVENLALDDEEIDAYDEVRVSLIGPQTFELLGYALGTHGDAVAFVHAAAMGLSPEGEDENESRTLDLAAHEARWRSLFSLPFGETTGYFEGAGGRLGFWIREDDLQARAFERTWLDLEME